MGSVASRQNFSSGWDPSLPDQISLRGGIPCFQTKFLFGMGSRGFVKKIFSPIDPLIFLCIFIISPMRKIPLFLLDFLSSMSMSTPQVFEQSLFLFDTGEDHHPSFGPGDALHCLASLTTKRARPGPGWMGLPLAPAILQAPTPRCLAWIWYTIFWGTISC